jgi:NitT/TauT family transport system substrate-binding protein
MWRSLLVVGSGLMITLAACGGGSSGTAAKSPGALEKTHVTVGALPVAGAAGLYLAISRGYFRQEGLTVSVDRVNQSTAAIPDMLHGTVDVIGSGNYVSFFKAAAAGVLDLKIVSPGIGCAPDTFDVLTLPGSGIRSPAQLAGKTIAVNLTNDIQTLTINTDLKSDGVNPGSVHYVVVPFPDMAAALKAHRVDAISVIEPFITGARRALGASTVLDECAGPTAGLPLAGSFTTAAWTQKYPDTARAFARAMARGQALAARDPAAVRQILTTYTSITPAEAALVHLSTYPAALDAGALRRLASLMRSAGLLSAPLNVGALIFR